MACYDLTGRIFHLCNLEEVQVSVQLTHVKSFCDLFQRFWVVVIEQGLRSNMLDSIFIPHLQSRLLNTQTSFWIHLKQGHPTKLLLLLFLTCSWWWYNFWFKKWFSVSPVFQTTSCFTSREAGQKHHHMPNPPGTGFHRTWRRNVFLIYWKTFWSTNNVIHKNPQFCFYYSCWRSS